MRIERDIINQFKACEDALMWLEDAGMIYRVFSISKPGMPLSAYEETDAFKVYACDCGLLRRLAHLPATVVTNPVANYTEFKGAMAENAVLQSMMPLMDDQVPYYWTSPGTAEVEFVIQWGDEIIPIEVKAEENVTTAVLHTISHTSTSDNVSIDERKHEDNHIGKCSDKVWE
jgi:predicted AAA+ superfamily ATPase